MLVYDLLVSPDCLPDLTQGGLKNKGLDEAFLLSSFRLHSKTPSHLYSIINPRDNSKYLEFTLQAKLNKGKHCVLSVSIYKWDHTSKSNLPPSLPPSSIIIPKQLTDLSLSDDPLPED